jgi:transcriptional regulator with XRE-family HTH domain
MAQKRDRLKQVRASAGFTQEDLAHRLGVDTSTVWRWEAGESRPEAWQQPRLAKLLGISRAQLVNLLGSEQRSSSELVKAGKSGEEQQYLACVLHEAADDADRSVVLEVLGPSRTLELLDELVPSLIARYELEGPQRLAPETRELRRFSARLSSQITGTAERKQLARVAARQSALLAYMSVNLSRFPAADRYALDTVLLATAAEDQSLLAWIKGTQSLSAYYQGQYVDAVHLARVGVELAPDQAQRIRLLSNGVARAAGKLGDRLAVDQAVNEAFELVESQPVHEGITPCIAFAPYSWARTAANAATAYLSVGDFTKALDLTQQVSVVVDSSDSDWSRSLVHLDEANALIHGKHADLDRAAALGVGALAASASKPITSIGTRAAELATGLQRRGANKLGTEFVASVHEWQQRAHSITP